MSILRMTTALSCALIVTGCASASDRFKDGAEAEGRGEYYQAAMRYVDALDKDATMARARDRLLVTGDSAIATGLRAADGLLDIRDPVGAGEEFRALDRLLAAAQNVGVRLPTPAGYSESRRNVFNRAIDDLMAESDELRSAGDFRDGLGALTRIREDFQPDAEQTRSTREAESWLLLDWAEFEESDRNLRRAFGLAGEAILVEGVPEEVIGRALDLQGRALELGTRFVAVFPITATPALEGHSEEDPVLLLSDFLELRYWREPPAFISVADPILMRRLTRRNTPRGTPLRPGPILAEVGADFGVLIEIDQFVRSEKNLRQKERAARTTRDGTVTYFEESGTQRYDVRARVIVLDGRGRQLDDFVVSRNKSRSFERGVYEGDLRTLRMSRNMERLFDPVRQAQERARLEEEVIVELGRRLGDRLFERVLRRIR
jgi:hypothetical protein